MSEHCCLHLLEVFLADDNTIVDDCLKLGSGQLSIQSSVIKGKSVLLGLTKSNLRRYRYKSDEECLGCRKCLPGK